MKPTLPFAGGCVEVVIVYRRVNDVSLQVNGFRLRIIAGEVVERNILTAVESVHLAQTTAP